MEPAKIEWSRLESVFVIDDNYESINAPQWIDFLTSSHSHDDDSQADAWFCRPECNHPKTADDFLKSTTPSSKLLRSLSISKLIAIPDRTPIRQQPNLKKRGVTHNSNQFDDTENQNPNHFNKQQPLAEEEDDDDKDTHFQSAKDLLGGGDILAKITDLGSKLKKMASLNRPPFSISKDSTHLINKPPPPPPPSAAASTSKDRPVLGERPDLVKTGGKPKERKPFAIKDTCQPSPLKSSPYHHRTQICDDEENVPISVDLKGIKCHQNQNVMPIRTNPPTPQGFSASRDPTSSTPSKGPKSRLMNQKREVFQEMEQESLLKVTCTQNESIVSAGKQGRGLDVLWFLKPCTL